MPEIMNCPQCEGKLRVPDDLLGRAVTCPTCGVIFTAPAALPVAEEPTPLEPHPQDAPSTWPGPRQRLPLASHRGTLLLVLGILSIVLCGFLGPVAWILGSNDLKEIRAGRMDPEGEGTTNAGRVCGIIGTVVLVLQACCGIPGVVLSLLSSRAVGN